MLKFLRGVIGNMRTKKTYVGIVSIAIVSGLFLSSCGNTDLPDGESITTATNKASSTQTQIPEEEYKKEYAPEQEIYVIANSFFNQIYSKNTVMENSGDIGSFDSLEEKVEFYENFTSNLTMYFNYDDLSLEDKFTLNEILINILRYGERYEKITVGFDGFIISADNENMATLEDSDVYISENNGTRAPVLSYSKTGAYSFVKTDLGWKFDGKKFIEDYRSLN